MVIYVLALLALFGSWLGRRELLQPAAFSLLGAGALLMAMGIYRLRRLRAKEEG